MGICISSPKVAHFDTTFNPIYQVSPQEVDDLINQMADELVCELKAKMPNAPKHKVTIV